MITLDYFDSLKAWFDFNFDTLKNSARYIMEFVNNDAPEYMFKGFTVSIVLVAVIAIIGFTFSTVRRVIYR